MKKLLITLLLISPFSFADEDIVYLACTVPKVSDERVIRFDIDLGENLTNLHSPDLGSIYGMQTRTTESLILINTDTTPIVISRSTLQGNFGDARMICKVVDPVTTENKI